MRGKKSRLFVCGMLAACMLIEQIATDTMTLRTYAASDTAVESQVQDSGGSDDGSLQVYTEDSGIQAVESEGGSSSQVEDQSTDTAGGTGQDTSSSDAGQKDSSETASGDAAGQDTGKTEDASQGGSSGTPSSTSGSESQDAADTSSGKTDETGGTSSGDGKSTASSSAATGKSESTGEDSSRPLTDEEKAAKEKEEKEKAEKEAALKDAEKKVWKADIKVIWEDDSNLYEQRPSSLRVKIADQEMELGVSADNNETTTTVEYTGEEEATEVTVVDTISNYDTSCEKDPDGVFVIRNTYKGSKKEVTININWINTLNRAEDWPSDAGSVTVKLKKNDDVKFDQVTFNSSKKSVTRNVLGDFDASNIDAPSKSGYSCVIESDDAKSNFTINYIANNRKIIINPQWRELPSSDLQPATISVKYGEGEHVYSKTFKASKWEYIELPDGVLVADTLTVDPVSGFNIEIIRRDENGYFVNFTYDREGTINVSVNWVDFDDRWGDRPKDIDIYFSKQTVGGAEQIGYTISADKDWKDSTISNQYLSLEWSINAEEVKNYTCTVSKFGKDSYTITYRHDNVKDCNIKVEWSGDEEHRDRRPNYVNIDILNNGNADDVFWSTQLSGNNDIASCQVPEGFDKNWIQPENVDYYVPFIYINDKGQYVIRYTYTENKAHLKVSWEDYNNVYNSRPESIRVKVPFQEESGGATQYYLELTKDDQTADNVWEKDYWYWDNTDPTELTVDDSKLGDYTSSGNSSVTATGGINYFLTLTYDALRRQDIVFDVEWKNDGGVTSQRPDYIYVDIFNNGKFLQTVKVSGTRETTVSVPVTVNSDDVVLEDPQPEDPDKNYSYYRIDEGYKKDGKLHYKIECESNGEQNEFSVKKKWIDKGHETERPESISVQLYADGKAQGKYITLSESNGWEGKFTNLPKLKNGEYTVKEVLPDEYEGKYKCEIKGDTVNTGYTITNTYIDHIPVKVIWNDSYKDSMSAFVRPDSFTMKIWLVNPESSVVFKISKPDLVNGNIWECTIEDPYNQIREYYDYTKELQLSDLYNYDVSCTFNKETGFVITCKNKYDYDQESITIKTEFEGDEGFESQRPDKIELIFSASGRADNWLRINREGPNVVFLPSNIFDKLTIKASNPQPSDITNADRYTYYVTKDRVALYTVHCVYSPVTLDVVKKWEDTGHKDERPSSVQVQVYVDDKKMEGDNYVLTLNGDNDWKGTFRLPELTDGKTYKVKEVIPEKYEDNYVSEVTGDTSKGFTITNTYAVKKTIKITKKWEDIGHEKERPKSVTVRLYDGTTLVKDDIVLSADNNWTTTVKVANNSASYHVEEVSVQTDTGTITVPDDEDAAPPAGTTTSTGTSTENQSAAPTAGTTAGESAFHYNVTYSSYTPTTTGTEEGYSEEFIITNTYKGSGDDYRDITITKLWDDNNNAAGKRPSSVKVKLLKQVGTDAAEEVCTVTLNEDNDWKTVVRAQAKYEETGAIRQEITYSVQEIQDETPAPTPTPTPEGGTTGGETEDKDAAPTPDSSTTTGGGASSSWGDTDGGGGASSSWGDTDKGGGASSSWGDTGEGGGASSSWGDTDGGGGASSSWGDTGTGGGASSSWGDPTTDEGAAPTPTPSTYTGTGTGVLYIPYYSGTAETGFTITNSYNLANTNIKVVWDDAGHEDVRPKQVTEIHLYKYSEDGNDADICGEISLDESVGWAAQVTNLYLDGTYYVAAPDLENYEKTIVGDVLDGFTITYIYRDDSDKTADIIIKKKWDMGDLAIALTHPDKATVQLKKNGEVIATQELSADNNWTFTMREQPLKDEKGEEIKYEVSEVNTPSGYEATVEESTQDTTGTDTSGQTTETANATASAETGGDAGIAGNTGSGNDASTSGNTGSGDGTGSAGGTGSGGGASYNWGSAMAPAKVFTVTNKYNGRTIHYKVEKKWDIDIEDNDRPDSIRVAIQKKNGDKWETVKVQSLGKDNGNSWTWEGNLPDGEYRARELKEDTLFDEFKQSISDVTKDTYTGWIAQLKASGKSYWSGLPDYLKNAADSGYDSLCDALNAKADDLHAKMMDYLGIASANDKIVDAGDDVYVDYHVPERTSVIEAGKQDAHVTHYKVTYKDSSDSCTITNEAVLEIDVIKRWIELNGAEAPDSVWVVLMMKPKASFMNNLPSGVLDYEFPVINPIKGGNNPLALIADFTVGFGSDLLNKISSSILPKLAIAKVSKDDNWKTTFVVSKYTLGIPMEFKGAEVTSEIVRQIVKYFLKIDLPISYNPIDGFISIPTKAIHTILGVESISDITDISGLAEKAMEKVKSMKMSDFGNLGFDTLLDAWHLMANVINIKFKIDWPDPDPDPVPNTIQGKKIWDDDNDKAKKRPEQVVVHLYKNGEAAKDENGNEITATISEKSSWRYVFTDCPDKDENGNPITYTVKEDPVEGYEVTYSGYNITNKYTGKTTTEEYSDIKITKVWDDVGHESERPDEVKVTLAGGAGVMSISLDLRLSEANQWTDTVEDMPLVYDGDEVAYTLTEEPLENYDTVISGSAVNGFIITNIYKGTDEGTIDIPVTKVWEDCGQEDKRPSQITVTLKNKDTDEAVGTVNLSAVNDWKAVFRAQPAKDAEGKEISYTVEESADNNALTKYESAITGSASDGFTITNTYKLEVGKVDVKITKQWEDLGHEDKRPAKIKATLKNADKTVAAVELSESNNWTAIVRSVQLKDALGREIEYTVEEEALENYDTAINGSAKDGFVITNAYDDQDPDTIDIPITKVWDDDNNAAGARPDSVKVALKNNGKVIATATLNEANDWTAVVRDQPIKDAQGNTIKYVVTEDPVAAYTHKVAGDALNGFTVTNRYVIQKITITKEWKEDEEHTMTRPDSINVKLIPDGHEDSAINVQLNADNNWKETVRVPVTNDDGEEIQYTVKEEAVKDYETVCGEAVKTGNGYSFTITNTYKPETKDLKITKIWKDNGNIEGSRPDEITVYLKANGETVDTITMKADGGSAEKAAAASENGEGQPAPAAENASSNTWTYTVTGKPVRDEKGKAITYTVEEYKTGDKIQKYSTKVEGDAENGFTITNTYDAVDITITKKWEDVGQEKNRPSEVKAKLTGNGKNEEVTLNAANNWTATVTGMRLTDDAGNKITYKVEEELTGGSAEDTEKLKKYTSAVTGDAETGFTITNTYDEKDANKIDILIRKEWKDDDDAAGKRSAFVKVALKKEGSEDKIVEAELSEENNWQVTVQDQPKNDDSGHEIKYVVTEDTVENYDTQISEIKKADDKDNLYTCTVTNTYDPNEQKITVTKEWKDEGHTDRRPDGVVIKLKANDIIAKTIWLSEDNGWTATYRMPVTMTGEDGQPTAITYSIEENPVEDYEATYGKAETTDDGTKLTVTNTYQQEKKKVKITKVWKDEGYESKRPEKVKIDLKANDKLVASITLPDGQVTYADDGKSGSEDKKDGSGEDADPDGAAKNEAGDGQDAGSTDKNTWIGYIENLPVRDEQGKEIVYTAEEDKTVEEDKIKDYKTEVSGDAESGFTITNTYEKKITFHVEKEWDIDLEKNDCPDSIKVALQKKDGDNWKTAQVVELKKDDGWKADVELPEGKYRARELKEDTVYDTFVQTIDDVTKETYSDWIKKIKEGGKSYWSSLPESIQSAANKGYDKLCDALGAKGSELREKMIGMLGASDADAKIISGEDKDCYVNYSVPERTSLYAGTQEAHKTRYKVSYKDEDNSCTIKNQAILEIDVIKRWIVPDGTELPESVWLVLMTKPSSDFSKVLPEGVLDYEFPVINPIAGGMNPLSMILEATVGVGSDLIAKITDKLLPSLAVAKVTKDDNWKATFVVSKYTMGIPMEFKGAEATSEIIRQIVKYFLHFDLPVSVNLLDGYISIPTKAISTIAGIENVSDLLDFSKLAGAALEKAKSLTMDDLKNLGLNTIMDVGHLMANVINIKFKIPGTDPDPDPDTIQGTKTWDDNDNAAGKRPETITVHLYKNGQPAKDDNGNEITATTSAKANWKYIFTNCPAKDDNGEAIKYSVREDPVPEEYEVTYSGYNITNKYTGKEENPEKISIPVVKKWVDQGQEDKRPESITVILKADGAEKATATLSASNDWSYTFEDLPLKKEGSDTEIKYEVEEKDKEAIEKQGYESVVSGNMNAGFTITNTYNHTDPDTIDIPVTKVWDDVGHEEERPSKITVKLMKEGSAEPVKTVELSKENDWKTTIYGLPKKEDGKDIVYRLEEDTESLNLQKYDTKITGDMNTGFTITNTYEDKDPLTIDIPIKKVWDDGENAANARPDSVKVTLVNRTSGKQVVTVELSEANNWSTVVRDQPQYDESGKEIVYAVSEDTVPGYDVAVQGSATEGFTVTNSMTMQKIKVLKKWEGDNDNTGTRPKSVSVTVQADGEMYAKFDLTAENNWTTTLQAPVKNKKGEEIKYTVTEETVNDYVTKVSEAEKTEEGYTFTITNTYKPETMDIRITKVWVDDSDKAGVRPENVVIRLIADDKDKHEWELQLPKGEVKISDGADSPARTESITVEKSADGNQWSALLRDLPVRNEKGETITYTVEESKDGWTTEQQRYATEYSGNAKSGFTVTNTLNGQEPEKIKIPVIKIWEDNDNAAGLRPKSVKIEIINKATQEVVDTVELTAANNAANEWKGTSVELPKTDDEGKDIEYAAKELTVEGYTTEGPTGNAQIGFTFTNKYADRKVVIKKVWAGDEERIDQRPKEVLVRLMANDITARTIILNADNNWEASYRVPLKGADGTAYTYSVTEDKVEDYKTEITSDTTEEGSTTVTTFTVTNTYEQEKKDIKVTKIWKDEGFESDRPSKVKIDLKANDKVVASISLPDGKVTKVEEESGSASGGSNEPADKKTDAEETAKENTPATDAVVNTAALTAEDGAAGGKDDTASGSGSASEGSGTESTETKASTEWTGTFENMPMRDKDGKEIQYSVTEDKTVEKDKIEKYETEYGGDAESGFTVTNSRNNTFTVTKEWDIDLLGNDCPDSIRVAIQKKEDDNWKTVKVVELTKADGWKMDVKVPEGTYRAREMQEDTALDEIVAKIEDVTKQTYGKWITSIKESGKEYWSGLPESIRSAADKGYDELCDALGAKGDDLTAKMKEMLGVAGADSKIVQAGDDSYVSYHVPQRGTEEAHQTKYKVTYKDEDSSCTIKNQAVLEIDVIKRWLELNGAQKPSKVVIVLMASLDQSKIAGLDTSGITLPEYANVEFPVVNPIKGGNNFLGVLADYSLGFGSDLISAITGFVPELAVAKVDESVNWRHSFVVSKYLYGLPLKYKGAEMTSEIIRQVVKYFTGFDSPVSFSPFGGFISIPTKAIHTILGIEDLEDITDLSKLAGKALEKAKTLTLDDFKNFGFDTLKDDWHLMANVINILFKIDIPPGDPDVPPNVVAGKKTWDDNDNAAGKRPETITVHLYKNGQPAVDKNGNEITATTSAAGEWRYSFTDCPPKDANGNKITYSVREDYVEWYTTIYDGMNVTNRYREDGGHEENIDITITKKWEDNDNAAKKRPATIKVNLKNGDLVVASAELSESNNWTQTIKDLPLKDAQGKEIDYKVEEVSVPGYTTVIEGNKTEGFTITNTYEEEVSNPIKIVIITKWVDEGHEDKRPDHVTIGLYADGDKVRGADQTASQEWTTVYENMPKFKKDSGRLRVGAAMLTAGIQGQSDLIQYSVTEDPVKNYTTVVGSAEEMDYGYRFIIVNTYTEEPDHGEYVPPTEPTVPTDPDESHLVPPNDPTTPTIPTTPTTPKTPTPPTSTTPPGGTTEVGSLQVSKAVKGSAEDKAKSFTFTVTLSLNGVPYVGTVGTEGVIFDAEGKTTFTLKDGETKLIEGIPAGLQYTVTEEKADGFKVVKTGETGTIETGQVKSAQFTNVHLTGMVTSLVPKTGDTSNAILWIGLIGAAVIVMLLVAVIGRKKKDQQDKK